MILEDFFTLSEMKDGLATLARVEELISVMQAQKYCIISNVGDAVRQWSTVASILASTENKDCLNHFVQLNGIWFLDHWLKEAQKKTSDANDGSVEELIGLLLGVLQRLPVSKEKSLSSGIGFTVKQTLCHSSHSIIEKARLLLDKWEFPADADIKSQDLECEPKFDDEIKTDKKPTEEAAQTTFPAADPSSSKEVDGRGCYVFESAENGSIHLNSKTCSVDSEVDTVKDVKDSISGQHTPQTASTSGDATGISGDINSLASSHVSNLCQESASITEESSVCPAAGMASTGTCGSPFARGRNTDDQPEFSQIKPASDDPKDLEVEAGKKEHDPCKFNQKEVCIAHSSSGLSSSSVDGQKSVKESAEIHALDSKEGESSLIKDSEPQQKNDAVDHGLPKYMITAKEPEPVGQDLSGERPECSETPVHGMDAPGTTSGIEENGVSHLKAKKRVASKTRRGAKQTRRTSIASEKDFRRSDIGLEYGDDALEFAVQVAIEAKREVADREQCSSSPLGTSGDESMDSGSSELEEDKCAQPNLSKSSTKTDHSADDSSLNENSSRTSENSNGEDQKDNVQELESPKSTPIQEPARNIDATRCSFDLNEDICDDDVACSVIPTLNHQNNLSVPKAVVAASKGPALQVTPLHFEGELGWRGSAATSAFRPASPRRTPDGHTEKSNSLKFDLNIAEDECAVAVDPVLEKHVPDSSRLPSGDSSIEVSSRRAERLKLDLNRLGDEETFSNPSSDWKLHLQTRNRNPSPTSSTRPSSMKDIDLNDNPVFADTSHPHNMNSCSSKDTSTYRSYKFDNPVATIMGSRMTIERKELSSQTPHNFLGNGLSIDSVMSTRPSLAYPNMPAPGYGYGGLALGPPALSVTPPLYGPGTFPCMVDSQGATVIPQVRGYTAVSDYPPSSRPHFLASVTGTLPPSLGVVGSSRPTLDLNSGAMSMDSGQPGSFRQLFMPGQHGITEEQMKAASQSTAMSGMSLKRKEPDGEWEPYPIGYKR